MIVELRMVNGKLNPSGTFKLIATGYLIGAGVIFVPLFAIATLFGFAIGAPTRLNGGVVGLFVELMPLIMVPIIVAMQALMIGGIVVFGLWLYQKRWPIRVFGEGALS